MSRIISYGEKTEYNDGDYLLLDNSEGGTKRIRADRVGIQIDPTLSQSGRAADAKTTGDVINEVKADLGSVPYGANAQGQIDALVTKQDEYFGKDAISIQLSDLAGYDKHDGTIGSQGAWTNVTDTLGTYKHIAIPIPRTGCRLQLTNGAGIDLIIAGLKTYTPPTANGEAIDFSATFGRTVRGQGGSVSVDLPDDVKYVVINMIVNSTDVTISSFSITKARVDGVIDEIQNQVLSNTTQIKENNERNYTRQFYTQIATSIPSRQTYRTYIGATITKGNWYKIDLTKISGRTVGETISIKTTSSKSSDNVVEDVSVVTPTSSFNSETIYFQCSVNGAKYLYVGIVTDPANIGLNVAMSELKADIALDVANDKQNDIWSLSDRENNYFGTVCENIDASNLSSYILRNGTVNSSNKWTQCENANYEYIIIPIKSNNGLLQFKTDSNNATDAILCGLKEYHDGYVTGDDAIVATTIGRKPEYAGATRAYYLSDDCRYLLVPVTYNGKAVNFTSFRITWSDRKGVVGKLNDYAGRSPVMCFIDDDGFSASLDNWEELCDETGINVTFALVTSRIGTRDYITTWDNIERLTGKGHEFVSHTHNHINLHTSTDETILADSEDSTDTLRSHGINGSMYVVYPFGNTPLSFDDTIGKYYVAGVTTGDNSINTVPIDPHLLVRSSICSDYLGTKEERTIDGQTYNLFIYKTLAEMKTIIDSAIANKGFLIWMTHLRAQPNEGYWYDDDIKATLKQAIEYAAENGVKVVTFGDGYKMYKNRFKSSTVTVDCDGVTH